MNTIKFKTNIKCTGCLAKVTPQLNETVGENNWRVNLDDPQKTLTVESDRLESEIQAAVNEAGFEAEKV
ncbi:MAG TPA: heavy metal-associated domain-containing protein [Sphingobacteriaceae bacterium]|nr:heavy metal-associated domain-containing protein [Sphingobacteriaceae bacterium]